MSVAERLNKDEEVVRAWPIERLQRWMGYFKLKAELEAKALKDAKRAPTPTSKPGMKTIVD